MKKFCICFLCAIFCFFTCTSTFYASSSIDQVDYHYPPEQLACYYFFKSMGLTDHPVARLSGQYIQPSYSTSSYVAIRDYYNVLYYNSSSGSLSKVHYISNDTTINITYITNDSRNIIYLGSGNGVTIKDNITYSNGYYIMSYTIKSNSVNTSPSFYSVVYGNTWILPDSFKSSETDDSLKAIKDLLVINNQHLNNINNSIGVTNNHLVSAINWLSLSNQQLLDIYTAISYNNNSTVTNDVNNTNDTLNDKINGLESIESTYINNLNNNIVNNGTSNWENWTLTSSNLLSATSFISTQLNRIFNSNSIFGSFTTTVLVIGFAFIMIGVIL